jgi:hypothetical protein
MAQHRKMEIRRELRQLLIEENFWRDAEVLIASLLVEILHELSLISALQFLS